MPLPPRPVPPLLLPLPCVTAPSVLKRADAVVFSRAYRSYNLAPHAIPRMGERAAGRRGMRRGSGVSGRAAGMGEKKKQDRSNLSKHVQKPAIGTRSGSPGDRSGRAPAAAHSMGLSKSVQVV